MPGDPNLRVLETSRRTLRRGDVFALSPADGVFLFGRVIDLEASIGGFPGILLYVYDIVRSTPEPPDVTTLTPARLLVPPMSTNRLGWSRGYFKTVLHADLRPGDTLRVHCFRDTLRGRYFDEHGRRLAQAVEPVGEWGLQSYRTIDDAVSAALGIPLAPD